MYRKDGEAEEGLIESAKIADFGSCRISDSSSGEGSPTTLAGTPLYMAPEVGANVVGESAYGWQVDMWSMGVLLFHAIAGAPPFDEGRLCKLFLLATTANYDGYQPPPIPPNTCPRVADIVARLLRLDPLARLSPAQFVARAAPFHSSHLRRSHAHDCAQPKTSWRYFLVKNILTYFRDHFL